MSTQHLGSVIPSFDKCRCMNSASASSLKNSSVAVAEWAAAWASRPHTSTPNSLDVHLAGCHPCYHATLLFLAGKLEQS